MSTVDTDRILALARKAAKRALPPPAQAVARRVVASARHKLPILAREAATHTPLRDRAVGGSSSQTKSSTLPSGPAPLLADNAEAVWSGTPATPLYAAVVASDRLTDLLDPAWHQERPRRGGQVAADTDLLLVEMTTHGVPGWGGPAVEQLVNQASDAGVPLVVLVTSVCTLPDWARHARIIMSTDSDATAALQEAGVEVEEVYPFAQPMTQGPAQTTPSDQRRAGQVGVLLEADATIPVDDAESIATTLKKLGRQKVLMVAADDRDRAFTLPSGLPDRIEAVGHWSEVGGSLGRVRTVLDLSATSSSAPWTTTAAAMHGTPLVGLGSLSRGVAPEIAEAIVRAPDEFVLRTELGARIHQDELFARDGHRLLRAVMRGSTATHRVRSLADQLGLTVPPLDRTVSAVVPTSRAHEIDNTLANLGRQEDVDVELVLVLHGFTLPAEELRRRAEEAGVRNLVLVEADRSLTLGAIMNLGVEAASGRYVAKMDDDNYYGPQFLADLVDSFAYSGAGIVGKWCHYVWLTGSRAVVLRFPQHEHRFTDRVQGGAMLFEGDVIRELSFGDLPRRVDSDILDRAKAAGIGIYSGDRYNFVSVRGTDRHSHTWTVPDGVFLTETGRLAFYGDPREHVDV